MKHSVALLAIIIGLLQFNSVSSQQMIFSTEKGKSGILNGTKGALTDNKFEYTLSLQWVNSEMQPVRDEQSLLCFDKREIIISHPGLVRLISDHGSNQIISLNNNLKLLFEVDERFPGGEVEIRFPWFYAESRWALDNSQARQPLSFSRPRNFAMKTEIDHSKIIDKTPPLITVVSPEGVNEGLKPILETTDIEVVLNVTDFFGIDRVMVNNNPATRRNDSTWFALLTLRPGFDNPINVSATDKSGLLSTTQFVVESRRSGPALRPEFAPPVVSPVHEIATVQRKPSELQIDIPVIGPPIDDRFALIIGNEDYSSYQTGLRNESDVEFAIQDAETFKMFATNILGVPEKNIIMLKNARAVEMHRALNRMNLIAKNTGGDAEFFVMYAGHGFPDERTREPYLIPVDISGADLEFAIKLSDFYAKLTEHPIKRVTVFLDACFTGGGREQGLVAARSVRVRPREEQLAGPLVVFSASSGDQSAHPYKEVGHGMFTYFLLSKIKESQGSITYEELSAYLTRTVSTRSILVNSTEQNPQTNISPSVENTWKTWRLRD
jgi:hypothetical protein